MRTLTCNGMSKSFCMTGWRLGYGGGPKKLIDAMSKLQSQSTFHPSTISQYAAIAGLNGSRDFITDQKKSYEERRNITVSYLNNIDGITCNTPEGSFYAFPSCKDLYGKRTPNGEILKNSTPPTQELKYLGLAVYDTLSFLLFFGCGFWFCCLSNSGNSFANHFVSSD